MKTKAASKRYEFFSHFSPPPLQGRLTLLLGPPGCGKSTLLLALAQRLDSNLKVSGSISYNGHSAGEFYPKRTVTYVPQVDLHMGELTVRETLDFGARCQGVGANQGEMGLLRPIFVWESLVYPGYREAVVSNSERMPSTCEPLQNFDALFGVSQ